MVSNIDVRVEAQNYASRGFQVLPLYGIVASRCNCSKRGQCTPGKHPAVPTGVKAATACPRQVAAWFSSSAPRNIGIATGGDRRLLVVDIDPRNGGHVAFAELVRSHGRLPKTVTTETGGDGLHFYFTTNYMLKKTQSKLGPGIDTLGERGYVVAPPSTHVSGGQYRWRLGCDPFSVDVAMAPSWLIEMLLTLQVRSFNGSSRKTAWFKGVHLPEGTRNNGLTRLAGRYWWETGDRHEVLSRLLRDNETLCKPPLDQSEVEQVATSVCRYPRNNQSREGGTL